MLLLGYLLGLPVPTDKGGQNRLPPSISRRLFNEMCPESERVKISRDDVQEFAGKGLDLGWGASGKEVLDTWLKYLNQPSIRDKKCVEVKVGGPQIFDLW